MANDIHIGVGLRTQRLFNALEYLNEIGIALSQEKDTNRLLETILIAAKRLTNADGGTLYRVEGDRLKFEIVRTDSLKIAMGGSSGNPIPFYPIQLKLPDGRDNNNMVAAYAALNKKTVNIADAYTEQGFDFSGTRNFDEKTGYRSKSFLTVPMKNHEGEVIGVLQLLNRLAATGAVTEFSEEDQRLAESLASQAAIALTNRLLIEQLEALFESLIELINNAIDEKSPYTGGHCQRVPALTMMIADATNKITSGPLAGFTMSEKDRYELKIAGLLHDCGKITTPVHVVDKATKLQTIFDRIEMIDTRFEVLKREWEIDLLRAEITALREGATFDSAHEKSKHDARCQALDQDRDFLRRMNLGAEKVSEQDRERVTNIASHTWRGIAESGSSAHINTAYVDTSPSLLLSTSLLTPNEVENLNIPYGTLTVDERQIINNHIVSTINMLEALPWPTHLAKVPEYAGGHHERMDGKGYPKGLTREQMSVQARIMGIADIFEALTAKDRPYKPGKTLSESLDILGKFALNGHIDPDLFDVFVREKVYLKYAQEFLDLSQIDEVDESRIPGYVQ